MKDIIRRWAMLSGIVLCTTCAATAQNHVEYCGGGRLVVSGDTITVVRYMAALDSLPVQRQVELRQEALDAMKAKRKED